MFRGSRASWIAPVVIFSLAAAADTRLSPDEGLAFEDAEHGLRAGVDGLFALDGVFYDRRNARDSQIRLDRALLGATAGWREIIESRVMFDLAGIDTQDGIWEAWASARRDRFVRLSAGLLPIALGVEDSFSEGARSLVGYPSFASFLSGRTDVAVELDGEIGEGLFSYDVSYAVGNGFDRFGQRRGDPQLAVRAVTYPLRWTDAALDVGPYHLPLLSGFFVSYGRAWLFDYDAHLDVATPLRNKLFDTGRLDGRRGETWHLGFGVDFGPLRIVHETVKGGIDGLLLPSGIREDIEGDEITSWHVLVAWRVTGEPYDSRPFRQRELRRPTPPRRPMDGEGDDRGWGALELAVRYANADIDRDFQTFGLIPVHPVITGPEGFSSSQEFRAFTFAINWDPTAYLRVSGEVVRVIADQHPAVFDSHGRDTSGLIRVQYAF
jgi:Phosphate-selective porin O and P